MANTPLKKCTECKQEKTFDSFTTSNHMKDKKASKCKSCLSTYRKTLREKDPKRYDSYATGFLSRNPGVATLYAYKNRHGISKLDVLELVRIQGGCKICGTQKPAGPKGQWHMDHDHNHCKDRKSCSSCQRGVLCNRCNLMLGLADDNIETLEKAMTYLKEYQGRKYE